MWYYLLLGEEMGPVSLDALKDLVRHGDLGAGDEVRPEGEAEWRRIADVQELTGLEEEPTSADLDAMLGGGESDPEPADDATEDFGASSHELDLMLVEEQFREKVEAPPTSRWYCKVLNQELGPFSFDSLLEMVEAEEIARDDLVRSDHGEDWQVAENIVGLFTKKQRPSRVSKSSGGVLSPQRAAMFKAAPKRKEDQDWYNRVLGQEFGPVSWKALQAELRAGKLSAEDEVRVASEEQWKRVADIPELAVLVPQAKPRPAAAASAPAAPAPVSTPPEAAAPPAPRPEPVEAPAPRPTPPPSFTPPSFSASRPSAPPAPSRSSRSSPSRSSSSGGGMDLSALFSGIKLDPKVIGGVAGVALLAALFFSGLLGGGDQPHFDKVNEIYVKVTELAQKKGDAAAWQSLGQSVEASWKEHQAVLEKVASSKRPALRTLLDVYRYTLPRIFTGTDEEREAALKILDTQMEAAKRTL